MSLITPPHNINPIDPYRSLISSIDASSTSTTTTTTSSNNNNPDDITGYDTIIIIFFFFCFALSIATCYGICHLLPTIIDRNYSSPLRSLRDCRCGGGCRRHCCCISFSIDRDAYRQERETLRRARANNNRRRRRRGRSVVGDGISDAFELVRDERVLVGRRRQPSSRPVLSVSNVDELSGEDGGGSVVPTTVVAEVRRSGGRDGSSSSSRRIWSETGLGRSGFNLEGFRVDDEIEEVEEEGEEGGGRESFEPWRDASVLGFVVVQARDAQGVGMDQQLEDLTSEERRVGLEKVIKFRRYTSSNLVNNNNQTSKCDDNDNRTKQQTNNPEKGLNGDNDSITRNNNNSEIHNEAATKETYAYAFPPHEEPTIIDATCAICLDEFEEGKLLTTFDKCPHVFHKECLLLWLDKHNHCPCCRVILFTAAELRRAATEPKESSFVTSMTITDVAADDLPSQRVEVSEGVEEERDGVRGEGGQGENGGAMTTTSSILWGGDDDEEEEEAENGSDNGNSDDNRSRTDDPQGDLPSGRFREDEGDLEMGVIER